MSTSHLLIHRLEGLEGGVYTITKCSHVTLK